jgi:catechol 2,3-dioxygenase-like lactoylglutathione lyase family enzyme
MLSVILACDDPYETARFMTGTLGWRLVFATPSDSDDKIACVGLGDAEVMLGTAEQEYLPAGSREHRGAGVMVYVQLPATEEIAAVHDGHARAGVVTTPLTPRPWGVAAFNALIDGYRFLITQEQPSAQEASASS